MLHVGLERNLPLCVRMDMCVQARWVCVLAASDTKMEVSDVKGPHTSHVMAYSAEGVRERRTRTHTRSHRHARRTRFSNLLCLCVPCPQVREEAARGLRLHSKTLQPLSDTHTDTATQRTGSKTSGRGNEPLPFVTDLLTYATQ